MNRLTIFIFAAALVFGAMGANAQETVLKSVTLDGSASFDPDGTIVKYEWSENGQVIATGVAPTIKFAVGIHTLTLTVTDDDGATSTDDVVITVLQPPNQPPVANAGPDQLVRILWGGSVQVVLNGGASFDPDGPLGQVAFHRWTRKRKQIAFGGHPIVNLRQGIHRITLEVEDYQGATDRDNVVITVAKKTR